MKDQSDFPMYVRPISITLHEEVKREWLEVWERLDVFGDDRISLGQMQSAILRTNFADDLPPEAVTTLLLRADVNYDGYISKEEFLILVNESRKCPKTTQLLRNLAFLTIPRSGRNAKIRQYVDEYSCRPPPIFMLTVTVLEISAFIFYGVRMAEPISSGGPVPIESPLIYNPERRYEAWRFLSYMFIHAGWVHLVNNVLMQLVLGIILELVHKWWRVMMVYLAGVLGGCLASSVTIPDAYLAGASGGVYALEYAYLGNLIMNWPEMSFPVVQAIGLSVISLLDVSYAVYDTYFSLQPSSTGYMAHLGGALAGLLMGVNVLRNLEKEPWERHCWRFCFILLVGLTGAAVIVHLAAPQYFPPQDHSPL